MSYKKDIEPSTGDSSPEYSHGQVIEAYNNETICPWAHWVPGPNPAKYRRSASHKAHEFGFTFCTCIIFVLSGYNCSLMGSVSSVSSYQSIVGLDSGSPHDTLVLGVINACYWIGVAAGAVLCGVFSDLVGRRKAIFCAALYALVIIPVFVALQNFAWALVLRILNGIATGALDAATLTWSMETASHKHRGRVVGLELASSAYGASFAYFAVYKLGKDYTSEIVWRFPVALQLIMVLITLVCIWSLPESPRWLIKVGLIDEARAVLMSTQDPADVGSTPEESISTIENTISIIRHAISEEKAFNASTSYTSMLFRKDKFSTARRTWTAFCIQFASQFMIGAGLVAAYGISIFQTGGWPADTSALLTGITMIGAATGGAVGAIFIADRVGRRKVFVVGGLIDIVCLSMVGMCSYFVLKYKESDAALAHKYSIAVIVLQVLFSFSVGLSWLWCGFTYPSEIFTAQSRARGSSVSVIGFATGSFVCNMIGSYIFDALGYGCFFLVAGMSLLVVIGCWLWIPETIGKTLEEIDSLYHE